MASITLERTAPAASIWDREHAPLTIGVVMAITLMAIEGLAMATVAPVLSDDLGGDHLYGWIFSSFMLASIIGTVVGGQEVDRRSPALVFTAALVLFTAGGLVAAFAPAMEAFLVGRALQGLASGAVIATSYAVINTLYEDALRPSMLAAESIAYVMPSLIGPSIVGAVAESTSWRWVFGGIVFFVIPVAILVLPRFRAIPPRDLAKSTDSSRTVPAVLLAVVTGLFLAGLEIDLRILAAVVAIAGLAGALVLLHRLLPAGTFRLQPVLPAAILSRTGTFGSFLIIETYMVYSLKEFGGASAAVAGALVSAGALTWSAGSWLQARVERSAGIGSRPSRIVIGVISMILGVAIVFGQVAFLEDIWLVPTLIGWMFAGLGIGFGLTTAAAVALAEAPEGQEGRVSSSMLLGDLVGASMGVGIGGVLLALGHDRGWSDPASAALAMLPAFLFLALAVAASLRLYWR